MKKLHEGPWVELRRWVKRVDQLMKSETLTPKHGIALIAGLRIVTILAQQCEEEMINGFDGFRLN